MPELNTSDWLTIVGGLFVALEMLTFMSVIYFLVIGVSFLAAGLFVKLTGFTDIGIISAFILSFISVVVIYFLTRRDKGGATEAGNIYLGEEFVLECELDTNTPTQLNALGTSWLCTLNGDNKANAGDTVIITDAKVGRLTVKKSN